MVFGAIWIVVDGLEMVFDCLGMVFEAIWMEFGRSGGQNLGLEAPEARTLKMSGAICSILRAPRPDPRYIRRI